MRLPRVHRDLLIPVHSGEPSPGCLQNLDSSVAEHDVPILCDGIPDETVSLSDLLREREVDRTRLPRVRGLVRDTVVDWDLNSSRSRHGILNPRCGLLPELAVDEEKTAFQLRESAVLLRDGSLALDMQGTHPKSAELNT